MSATPADSIAEQLRPLTEDPGSAAILCDIDGTLAPIVARPEDAHVHKDTLRTLGALARSYRLVACVSGRSVAEGRRLVGVGALAYVGSHGAEVARPGETRPRSIEAFASWEPRVRAFMDARENGHDLRGLRIRVEDKGPIKAFHWRGAPDEDAAHSWLVNVADEAEAEGLTIHWGRKVLEIRPPVHVDKGEGVRALLAGSGVTTALYGGDDATDVDAFDVLDGLVAEGALTAAVRVGVRSDEGPRAVVERADLVVDGVPGFAAVLRALAA